MTKKNTGKMAIERIEHEIGDIFEHNNQEYACQPASKKNPCKECHLYDAWDDGNVSCKFNVICHPDWRADGLQVVFERVAKESDYEDEEYPGFADAQDFIHWKHGIY